MKIFQEILYGIPLILRIVGVIFFVIYVLYIIYICVRYAITENTQYIEKFKKLFLIITVVIITELILFYCSLFNSEIKMTGLERFTTQSHTITDSDRTNERSTSQAGNEFVAFENNEFSIGNSDQLSIADIVSGEVTLQKVDETKNDIWYQYVLIPMGNSSESVAVGSYGDIIVTSKCSDLRWEVSSINEYTSAVS